MLSEHFIKVSLLYLAELNPDITDFSLSQPADL